MEKSELEGDGEIMALFVIFYDHDMKHFLCKAQLQCMENGEIALGHASNVIKNFSMVFLLRKMKILLIVTGFISRCRRGLWLFAIFNAFIRFHGVAAF